MSRVAFITHEYRCLRCSSDAHMAVLHALPYGDPLRRPTGFKARFWTAATFRDQPLYPTFRDLKCPYCGANPAWFESWPPKCANFILPMREDLRPVVFRSVDAHGREHYRYPAHNAALARPSEERVDFPTLRSMETFLKEQNPNHREWQVPLNDILDYDETRIDTALDETDPGAADDAEAVALAEGGVTSADEIEAFMARDDARALIESA